MGLSRLRTFLARHRRIALDTSVFVYQLEAYERYVDHTDAIFAWLEQPGRKAVTSTVTMTQLLVHPYGASDEEYVDQLYGLLSTYPHLDWIAPDLVIADIAARIRAQYHLWIPEALQAATAIRSQVTGIVTNDPIFEEVGAFETLVLDQLL